MQCLTRIASMWCVVSVASISAQPPAKPKAKIEFRWLEDRFVKELTQEKGIQTTCAPDLSYPHKKAVLTNGDIASARLQNHGSVMGLPGEHYVITFRLTDKAKRTLTAGAGDAAVKEIAVFADGKYWGTAIFRKAQAAEFEPFAGFINSNAEAIRIVESCK